MRPQNHKINFTRFHALAVFLAGALIYADSWDVPFQLDDLSVIAQNPLVRTLYSLPDLFRFDPSRFLTHLTFAINYHWGGFNAFGFHGVNITLHCCNAVLFYFLVKRTFQYLPFPQNNNLDKKNLLALGAALIFAVHPLQTESVTYLVQRSVLLAVFFYLIGLLGYIQLRTEFHKGFFGLIGAAVLLGTMTKPIFITLPLTVFLYEVYFLSSLKRQNMSRILLPYLLVLILVPAWIILFSLNYFSESFDVSKLVFATRTTAEVPRGIYFLTELPVIVRYIGLLFFPAAQNILHSVPWARSIGEPSVIVALLFIASLIFYAVRVRQSKPLLSFSILWFFILLIPESSIFPLSDVMFEHRLYLAVGCFAVIVMEGLTSCVGKTRQAAILGLIVVTLSILTYARNTVWESPSGLLEDAIAKSPGKIQLHNALGISYEQEGALTLALQEFQKAEALDRNSLATLNHLGRIYVKIKDLKAAETAFKKALILNSRYFEANFNLGNLYYLEKKWPASLEQYQRALALKPNDPLVLFKIGKVYESMKNLSEAERFYKTAILHAPYALDALYALGNIYLDQQNYAQAVPLYERVLKINPHYALAHNTLAIAYVSTAQPYKAERYFKEALRLNPNDITTYLNLIELYRRRGDKKNFDYYSNLMQHFISSHRRKEVLQEIDVPAF